MFEPNFTKVISSVRKSIGSTQSLVEIKIPTTDNDVKKIYSVGAKSSIVSSDNEGKELVYTGLVDFQAVYEEGGIKASNYSAEFKDKYLSDDVLDGEVVVTSNVIDVTSEVVSGGIKVVAVVEVYIDLIVSDEINVLVGATGEDCHCSTNDISYTTYLGKATEKIEVSEDIVLEDVSNILMVTPCVGLYKVDGNDNFISIEGCVNLDVCYLDNSPKASVRSTFKKINFDYDVPFDGVNKESIINSIVSAVYNEIKISTEIEDGKGRMSVLVPIVYSCYVFDEKTISVVEDVYLERQYLSITCENFTSISEGTSLCFKDNISGVASIDDDAPFIDEILGVCTNNIVVANCKVVADRLIIEGIVNATVMYYTKEIDESISVLVEMPFAIEQKVNGKYANTSTMCIENISARSKRGKEIEVSASLSVFVDVYGVKSGCVISQIVLGDIKPQEDCSLYLYIVREGQSLWDIAKDVGVSQEKLLEQNQNIELPLRCGDKLVIYKPNQIKF